jgi:hypothetical protein
MLLKKSPTASASTAAEPAGQDEETKLLTEGKVDEVFNRRIERLRGD